MKTPFLYPFLAATALTVLSMPGALLADGPAPTGATNSGATTAPAGGQDQRMERFKEAMDQLNLTDAQKDKIKQIRATVTDRKERRQQIMAVLTVDQQAKLKELTQEHAGQTPSGAATAPSAN
jgi:Spy/CpxP family protein refolding chaperone